MPNDIFLPLLFAAALAAYGLRAGGFALMRFVPMTPRVEAALRATPIGVMAGILVVALLKGGPAEWIAAALVIIAARLTGQEITAGLLGIATVALLRWWGF